MTQEILTEKIKNAIGMVITETVEHYKKGEERASWATIDSNENGRLLLVQWPTSQSIDVNWSPATAGYGDLGTPVGCISTEYFGIEDTVKLLTMMVNYFMEK